MPLARAQVAVLPGAPWTLPRAVRWLLIGVSAATIAWVVSLLPAVRPAGQDIAVLDQGLRAVCWLALPALVVWRAVGVRQERAAWSLLSAAVVAACTSCFVYYTFPAVQLSVGFPSRVDIGWLAMYPLALVGVALLLRQQYAALGGAVWLDALLAAFTSGALAGALLLPVLLRSSEGDWLARAVSLTYPTGDLLLLMVVVSAFGLSGWRPGRVWVLIGAGVLVQTGADAGYILIQNDGTWANTPLDAGYLVNYTLIALAAWQRPQPRSTPPPGLPDLIAPAACAVLSSTVLLLSALRPAPVLVVALAHAGVLTSIARTAVTFRQVRGLGQARKQARTDELTGLANRRQFNEALATALSGAGSPVSVLLIDLDGFKEVNDSLGHLAGDELLTQTGQRFAAVLGTTDLLARLGGDEYAVLAPDRDDRAARETADRLRQALSEPFVVHSTTLRIDASIGTTTRPALCTEPAAGVIGAIDATAPAELPGNPDVSAGQPVATLLSSLTRRGPWSPTSWLPGRGTHHAEPDTARTLDSIRDEAIEVVRRADVAMYRAKTARSGIEHYDASYDDVHTRLRTIAELRAGLARGEFVLHYQPKVAAVSQRMVGVEALVRWEHPERGLLFPDAFLTLVEQAGLSRDLTDCVLNQALRDCAAWAAQGASLTVAVNLTTPELLDLTLPQRIAAALQQAGLSGPALTVEITEGVFMTDKDTSVRVLEQLRRTGIKVSIDDYGTGYSSLAYLRQLPLDELKLDRSFISQLGSDARARAVVVSTVALAHSLGLSMVAEGVETGEDLLHLQRAGCDVVQGYHLSRPLGAQHVLPWAVGRRHVDAWAVGEG